MGNDLQSNQTVLVTGYAKAPKGTVMQEIYSFCGVIFEIDPATNIIVDAEIALITDVAKRFFKTLLVGRNLDSDLDLIIAQIKKRYLAPSRDAMIIAIKTATQRYWEAKKNWDQGLEQEHSGF